MPLPIRYVESEDSSKKSASATADQGNDHTDTAASTDGDSLPKAASLPILDAVVVPSNRIQALGVHNISTVIRQLSSIAKHAESVMGDIADVLISYHQRTLQLEERTRRLREEVLPSLDPEREAAEGFEIPHPDFHFKSDRHIDQHLLSKQHIPQPLVDQIKATHTPPLYLLTPLNEDGKNSMKIYSNPDFFFEHWCSSIKKEALRRKSTMDVLSPVAVKDHSKTNGAIGNVRSQDHTRAFKRNTRVSRSFRSRTKPPQYGSNLSLQDAGSRSKSSSLRRSYSMRGTRHQSVPLKYAGSMKLKGRSKAHGFTRVVAANFEEVDLNLALPTTDDVRHHSDRGRSASPIRDEKGRFLSRTFSIRRSRSHSRSRSPNPQVPAESIFNGSHVYLLETELQRQQKSQLSVLSKQHLENLDLGSADFETCLASSKKVSSTFKTSIMVSSRPITPIIHRIPTPTLPATPKVAPKRRVSRSSSDAKDKKQFNNFQRSATVSSANLEVKRATNKLKNKLAKDGRPSSVALEVSPIDAQQTRSDSAPYLRSKALSQLSLPSRSKDQKSSSSSSSSPQNKRHSTALLDETEPISVSTFTQEPVKKTPQIKYKPRRPAPARPTDDKRPSSKESASPAVSTPNSSPIPGPPPPPRNDSLNNLKNQNETTVNASSGGSSPATPGTAHTAQRHSTLDSQKKESVANAISNVLANIARRSLQSPKDENPLSPVGLSSPVGLMRAGSDGSPSLMSPTGSANRNTVISPTTKRSSIMSPTAIVSRNAVISPELVAVQLKEKRASLRRQSSKPVPLLLKQESLYISPRKLSLANHLSPRKGNSNDRMEEILKAGGVDAEDYGSNRGDLLAAIRKGIQLRKVEEVAPGRENERDENNPWDVAAILDRYHVLHSESDESDSEVEWDELDEL